MTGIAQPVTTVAARVLPFEQPSRIQRGRGVAEGESGLPLVTRRTRDCGKENDGREDVHTGALRCLTVPDTRGDKCSEWGRQQTRQHGRTSCATGAIARHISSTPPSSPSAEDSAPVDRCDSVRHVQPQCCHDTREAHLLCLNTASLLPGGLTARLRVVNEGAPSRKAMQIWTQAWGEFDPPQCLASQSRHLDRLTRRCCPGSEICDLLMLCGGSYLEISASTTINRSKKHRSNRATTSRSTFTRGHLGRGAHFGNVIGAHSQNQP